MIDLRSVSNESFHKTGVVIVGAHEIEQGSVAVYGLTAMTHVVLHQIPDGIRVTESSPKGLVPFHVNVSSQLNQLLFDDGIACCFRSDICRGI